MFFVRISVTKQLDAGKLSTLQIRLQSESGKEVRMHVCMFTYTQACSRVRALVCVCTFISLLGPTPLYFFAEFAFAVLVACGESKVKFGVGMGGADGGEERSRNPRQLHVALEYERSAHCGDLRCCWRGVHEAACRFLQD